mmetsp:Transcript_37896/g.82851  ORF Transcript_37896/g.82851 Transcript_37896/m.82851 type:complete len:102 (-) Transcript_37896:53-358(-)
MVLYFILLLLPFFSYILAWDFFSIFFLSQHFSGSGSWIKLLLHMLSFADTSSLVTISGAAVSMPLTFLTIISTNAYFSGVSRWHQGGFHRYINGGAGCRRQ